MKTKNKILCFLTILPTIITAIAINFMAAKVPMHYNGSGEIDRWGSKYENFIFPILIIFFTLFWEIMIFYYNHKIKSSSISDKDKNKLESNANILILAAIGTTALFTVMQCVILLMALDASTDKISFSKIDINTITNVILGIFIILISNYLPKTKNNGLVGIRTSWSMINDKTWSYSNRYGSIALMISGFLIIIETLLIGGLASTFIEIGILIIATVISVYISYVAYKKYGKESNN